MKTSACALALFLVTPLISEAASDAGAVGEVVFDENPASPQAQGAWGSASWVQAVPEGENKGACLRLDVPQASSAPASTSVQQDVTGKAIPLKSGKYELSRQLDLTALRGWRVDVEVHLRDANVPPPPLPWEGLRLGLRIKTAYGNYDNNDGGQPLSGDWRTVRFSNVLVPDDAVGAVLYMGLIAPKGTLWIDRVRVIRTEAPLLEHPVSFATRWRGAGSGTSIAADDFVMKKTVDQWHLNVIKYWIGFPNPDLAPDAYAEQLENILARVDHVLSLADSAGIRIILQGTLRKQNNREEAWKTSAEQGGTQLVYLDPHATQVFVDTWRRIAARYVGRKTLAGYDLLNETVLRVPPAPGCPDWNELAERTSQAINAVDTGATIYVQCEEWWGVRAFTKLRPIQARNIVYSVHMYEPLALTHQGVSDRQSKGISYPGIIQGVMWDKETLRAALHPARHFQLAYGVPIQVGEFSCIRWAPDGSRERWLKDVIDLFEEYGWDWTYHALYNWDGWNLSLGPDPADLTPPNAPTPAKAVLLDFFSRNTPLEPAHP